MSTAPPPAGVCAGPQEEAPPDADGGAGAPRLVRRVMQQHAKSVVVITAGLEAPVGFCATSLAPVSLNPPVLSFSLAKRTRSWRTIEAADHVMAHLLAADQQDLARLFADPDGAKFGPAIRWRRGARGLPVLGGALAYLLLAPVTRIDLGDHALVVNQVRTVRAGETRKGPLLHYDGRFGRMARPGFTPPWP